MYIQTVSENRCCDSFLMFRENQTTIHVIYMKYYSYMICKVGTKFKLLPGAKFWKFFMYYLFSSASVLKIKFFKGSRVCTWPSAIV